MSGPRPALNRADLPAEFTAETIRELPISTLRRLSDHRNGILNRDDQRAFDKAVHELMRGTAERVARQFTGADWSTIRRDGRTGGARVDRPASRTDKQLQRIARRIGQQVDLAEALAPDVDWTFAQPRDDASSDVAHPDQTTTSDTATDAEQDGTVSDLEQRISEQVELVEVMSEIAEMSKRTFALEQQRDLQNTRGVFFGLVVSVAVLVAGWAPLVTANDWGERVAIICLTVGTCLVGGAVYALVRHIQNHGETSSAAAGEVDTASSN